MNESGAREGAPFQSTEVPARGKVVIEIEKRLPVQGGMGAASSNAVATMLGLERALGIELSPQDKLRIAAEVGSDLPLFLIGGTVLGVAAARRSIRCRICRRCTWSWSRRRWAFRRRRPSRSWDELATLEAGLTGSRRQVQ